MITTSYKEFDNKLTAENQFQTITEFLNIYDRIKEKNHFIVTEISLNELDKWNFVGQKESLEHESGKFFKVEGLRVRTNFGNVHMWEQPIINQPEIGILGIIMKIFKGTRYFLMQLKMEPGNINLLQLSPTVQATKSNFMQVHKGKSTLFLEYFNGEKKSKILIDQLQSEQGGRFLRKRNRNMIVEIYDEIKMPENFFWLTLGEIKSLLTLNNLVNMDARSVLSTIPLNYNFGFPKYADEEIIRWYIDKKVKYELEVEKIPLNTLHPWFVGDKIYHRLDPDRFFSVVGVKIETGNREICSWTQPILKDLNEGLIGLVMKKFNNEDHYLFQTKVMPGNIDIIDLSPTISISNYKYVHDQKEKPLFLDRFIEEKNAKILYQTKQSEEGGRFYHLQTVNMIVEATDNIEIPDNYTWLTKNQINRFMPYSMFNIEARSLISTMT
jgi:oxidase EvaA